MESGMFRHHPDSAALHPGYTCHYRRLASALPRGLGDGIRYGMGAVAHHAAAGEVRKQGDLLRGELRETEVLHALAVFMRGAVIREIGEVSGVRGLVSLLYLLPDVRRAELLFPLFAAIQVTPDDRHGLFAR